MNRTDQAGRHHKSFSKFRVAGFVVAIALANTGAIARSAPVGGAVEIGPDAPMQAAIQAYANASSRADADEKLAAIRTVSGRNYAGLIDQLLLYSATSQDTQKSHASVGRILAGAQIPKEAAVTALVPQLDNTNPAIQKLTRSLLHSYEDRSATRPPDFSTYRAIIETAVRAGKEPSDSLVKFMYQTDPGSALLTMMRGYQLRQPSEMKPILWAEHVVADLFWKRQFGFAGPQEVTPAVMTELDTLSKHQRWWVRLYVAAILQAHPELQRPEMVERLKNDQTALVREVLSGK